ncbi:MAG: glycosyltransferase family 39 protein [Alphaproteobacteria bacterium]|nr:glycosyltransferase family 39 protein [Alphaproteobacteria bacterium]
MKKVIKVNRDSLKNLVSVGLFFCALIFFFTLQLGNRPFATPDEGRYVEIPREMVATGDYLTPRLNNVKYFEKPPFFYWLQASSIKMFGLDEAPMRLWVVFFAFIGCLATYHFGKTHFDRTTGFFSAFVLGSSVLYFSLSRLIILDMPVSVLVTLILYSFYQGFETEPGPKRRFWFYCFSVSCALGVLTKGIMALAIPGPIIVIWLSLTGGWKRVLPVYLPTSLFLFFLIAAPWHILVSLQNPEFAYKYFIVEHFMRYTTDVHLRYKPFWFFIPILIAGFLPWTAFILSAIMDAWKNKTSSLNSYLLIWGGWVFAFFSISNSKLIPYILPMFPALSLLIGKYLSDIWTNKNPKSKTTLYTYNSLFCIILCLLGGGITFFFPKLLEEKIELLPYIHSLMTIFFANGLLTLFYVQRKDTYLSLENLTGSILVRFFKLRTSQAVLSIICISSVAILITLINAAPYMQRPSIKPLAEIIQAQRQPDDKVVSFMTYYQDLPVYTQQTVIVVEAKGELEFGTIVEDTSSWMVNEKQFLELWHKKQKIWGIGRKAELDRFQNLYPSFKYKAVGEDSGNILFTQSS